MKSLIVVTAGVLFLTGCSQVAISNHMFKRHHQAQHEAAYSAPPITEKRKVGNPYVIDGVRYYPMKESDGYRAKGIASWYGRQFHGRPTANGERYDMYKISAAHKTLPLPTWVRVTNLENGRSLVVRVNDRGPFRPGRIIDMSYGAARALDMADAGLAPVVVEALPIDGSRLATAPTEQNLAYNTIRHTERPTHYTPEERGILNQRQARTPAPAPRPVTSSPAEPVTTTSSGSFTERMAQRNPVQPAATEPYRLTRPPQLESEEIVVDEPAPQLDETVAPVSEPTPRPRAPQVTPPSQQRFEQVHVYVQVGAFSDRANAERVQAELTAQGKHVILQAVQRGEQELTRVRVGPLLAVDAADKALAELVQAGYNTAIIVVEEKN